MSRGANLPCLVRTMEIQMFSARNRPGAVNPLAGSAGSVGTPPDQQGALAVEAAGAEPGTTRSSLEASRGASGHPAGRRSAVRADALSQVALPRRQGREPRPRLQRGTGRGTTPPGDHLTSLCQAQWKRGSPRRKDDLLDDVAYGEPQLGDGLYTRRPQGLALPAPTKVPGRYPGATGDTAWPRSRPGSCAGPRA